MAVRAGRDQRPRSPVTGLARMKTLEHPPAQLAGWIVWGASGHAKVLREALVPAGLPLVATFDNSPSINPPFADVPLFHGQVGFREWRATNPGTFGFLVAIGGPHGP